MHLLNLRLAHHDVIHVPHGHSTDTLASQVTSKIVRLDSTILLSVLFGRFCMDYDCMCAGRVDLSVLIQIQVIIQSNHIIGTIHSYLFIYYYIHQTHCFLPFSFSFYSHPSVHSRSGLIGMLFYLS